ncbi:MAG: VWA domain-containing protein, partial [Synergistaceae bacterium]|nr:VWA domain-containing protein [Synergistaceae bacterium]
KDGDVKMALISFSNTAQTVQPFTNNANIYKGTVNTLSADGGTNWEQALKIANELEVRDDAATFVVFVTDGDPTFRISRGEVSDNAVDVGANYYRRYLVFGEGDSDEYSRNFNFAVDQVKKIKGVDKNFYSIGISNSVTKVQNLTTQGGYDASHAFLATNDTAMEEAFEAITQSIKAQLGFGDVEITDGITSMTSSEMKVMQEVDPDSFTYYRYGGEDNKYGTATNMQEWDTREEDGCAAASYNKNDGTVHWDMGEGFQLEDKVTYVVTFRVWPSQAAYDLIADLNNNVKKYADLTDAEKEQVEVITEPSGTTPGSYALRTNTKEVKATYNKTTKTGDVVTISDTEDITATYHEGSIQNMALSSSTISLKKEFEHDIYATDISQLNVKVKLIDDGHYYPSDANPMVFELKAPDWGVEGIYIAPGLLTGTGANTKVLSSGHEFTLEENMTGDDAYNYEFICMTVRPMVTGVDSDGNPIVNMLVLKDDQYYTNPDHAQEFVIDGKTYYIGDSGNSLIGTNYKTAEIDFTKHINDRTGKMTDAALDAESFTYRITLTVPKGKDASGIRALEWVPRPNDAYNGTNRIYIDGYQGEADTSTPYTADATRFKNVVYGRYYSQVHQLFNSSTSLPEDTTVTFYMTLARNEVIRIVALPSGTTYTIEEVGVNVLNADDSANAGAPITSVTIGSNTPAGQGYSVSSTSHKGSASGARITGTIRDLDTRYYNYFTNTLTELNRTYAEIKVKKVVEGYEWEKGKYYNFKLTALNGAPINVSGTTKEIRVYDSYQDDTNTYGAFRFDEPGTYTYTIEETWTPEGVQRPAPVTLTVTVGEVNGELQVTGISGKGDGSTTEFSYDSDTATMLVTFINRMTFDVTVSKSFSGVDELPEGFKITNDYNDTEFTVDTAKGTGTEDDPYIWTIASVPVNTSITFTESGYDVENYTWTGTATTAGETAKKLSDDDANADALVVSDDDEAENIVEFTNTYERKTADLVVVKTFSGITAADLAEITGYYVIDYTSDEDAEGTAARELKIADAEADESGFVYTWTIEDAKVGETLTFTETGYEHVDYEVEAKDETGNWKVVEFTDEAVENPNKYEIENDYERKMNEVIVIKTFSGITAADLAEITGYYVIDYKSDDEAGTEAGSLKIADAKADESGFVYTWTINNAKVGETLTFTETGYEHDDYEVTPNAEEGTWTVVEVAEGVANTNKYEIENDYERKTVDVTVTKVFSGITEEDLGELLSGFAIAYESDDAEQGTAADKLTIAEQDGMSYTWTIKNAKVGETLTFTETGYEHEDYKVTATEVEGELEVTEEGENEYAIENEYKRKTLDVTVVKTFSGITDEDLAELSGFAIAYESDDAEQGTAAGTLTVEGAEKDGKVYSWTIEGAKVGETLTFTETGYEHADYEVTPNDETGTLLVEEGGENEYAIENDYERKVEDVTVVKTFSGITDEDLAELSGFAIAYESDDAEQGTAAGTLTVEGAKK